MLFSVLRTLLSGGHVDIWQVLAQVLSALFVIFCILPLHEFAHGWMACKLGDSTAKWQGRLTMNPLVSVDIAGALALIFFGFGWAKPVPIDSRNFKNPKRDTAITALAGPVSNLLAALVGAVVVCAIRAFAPYNAFVQFVYYIFYYYVVVNISLTVFNLLPVPPLDGSRILAAFLSDRAIYTYYRYQQFFVMLLFFLMLSGAFSGPLYTLQSFFAKVIFTVAEFPFKLFGAL